jgi:hypothetical protein
MPHNNGLGAVPRTFCDRSIIVTLTDSQAETDAPVVLSGREYQSQLNGANYG